MIWWFYLGHVPAWFWAIPCPFCWVNLKQKLKTTPLPHYPSTSQQKRSLLSSMSPDRWSTLFVLPVYRLYFVFVFVVLMGIVRWSVFCRTSHSSFEPDKPYRTPKRSGLYTLLGRWKGPPLSCGPCRSITAQLGLGVDDCIGSMHGVLCYTTTHWDRCAKRHGLPQCVFYLQVCTN